MAVDFVLTGTTTYNVPADATVTKVEAIGNGGHGSGVNHYYSSAAGAGGGYCAKNNPANFTPAGNPHACVVGAGGSTNNTVMKADNGTDNVVQAGYGESGASDINAGGVGVGGDVNYTGGDGLEHLYYGGPGGGGAAGPNGNGGDGGQALTNYPGAGGGGADGGSAGSTSGATNGGAGGASGLPSSTGGSAGTPSSAPTSGTLGGGGGGSARTSDNAANGSSGNEWDASHGCGGGGGGGYGGENSGEITDGGDGGNYGGGGGCGGITGMIEGAAGGDGAPGLLIITYTVGGASTALYFHNDVIDNGLNEIVTDATTAFICDDLPTTYEQASSTYKLGSASISFNSPANAAAGDGRKITSNPITGGVITATGTASHWAVCDASRLLAAGEIDTAESVTDGWEFSLGALSLVLPYE